ncbi:Response regulator PleD [bioreactor metagenome]|uniref:Response regulator PleD n=1 Tax=bioreactor metagenome TaxID=1076179 RepID=A0A645HYY8_9ZZZZ
MTLSLLIVYFYIQDVGLNTDYLTGVFNRRLLDYYLQEKIKSSTKQKTFSAILIDLDDFKQINDTYGHDAGDKTLQEFVKLLRSGLRSTDFIARFGGDEFYVILDISDKITLEEVVQRIRDAAGGARLSQGIRPIDFSMGYDIYDSASGMTAEDFKQHIDQLMYDEKKRKKCH